MVLVGAARGVPMGNLEKAFTALGAARTVKSSCPRNGVITSVVNPTRRPQHPHATSAKDMLLPLVEAAISSKPCHFVEANFVEASKSTTYLRAFCQHDRAL